MIKKSTGEKTFQFFNYIILISLAVVTLYPFLYVLFASISDPVKLVRHSGFLFLPAGFSLKSYELVFKSSAIYVGYLNTIFYVVVGTALNLLMTCIGGYALSKKDMMLRKFIMLLCIFTMYFNGGLIPNYLLIKSLHLDNTRWAIILPVAISTWNLIIMISSFQAIPESLMESARIDGAGEWRILFNVVIPLSLPTIMVILLYYAVGHWNSWFNAMLYLRDRNMYPLQLFLREILVNNSISDMTGGGNSGADIEDIGLTIKHATIMASTLPILFVYPFIQKHFVKGVMIGGVKG